MYATTFYRLSEEFYRLLEATPELMDWLLGCSDDIHDTLGEIRFRPGARTPSLSIGPAWDEILDLLARTGDASARRALDGELWEEFDGFEEIRRFPRDEVRRGCKVLNELDFARLRAEAVREPSEDSLRHLENIRNFWRDAAAAGEAIVSSTS